jgi:acyl carrier protein
MEAYIEQEAKEKIKKYIESNIIKFEDVSLSDGDNIFELGFVNSLFAMKLLNFVEKEFKIQVDDEDIDIKNFSCINNISNLVMKKRV